MLAIIVFKSLDCNDDDDDDDDDDDNDERSTLEDLLRAPKCPHSRIYGRKKIIIINQPIIKL